MREPVELDPTAHQEAMQQHAERMEQVRAQLGATALIPTIEVPEWVKEEQYSHSMHQLDDVGERKVNGTLYTPEGRVAETSLRECFESSVIEMAHTDTEFRRILEINRERLHIIFDGKVLALDGKTDMVGLCENGAVKAAIDALLVEEMIPVALRCSADQRTAIRVEHMPVGTVHLGVSMFPKEAMERYGTKFYDNLGFREGLAFLQWYYKIDEHTLLAASFSVDSGDLDTMRETWAEFGGNIPECESTNTWLDHAIQRNCTLEQARALVVSMRDRYYQKRGLDHIKRYSVDKFMAINKPVVDEMFATYLELAAAYHKRKKNEMIAGLVRGLLQDPGNMSREVIAHLQKINRTENLYRADAALIEQLIRYATVERLRNGLYALGKQERPVVPTLPVIAGQTFMQQMVIHMTTDIKEGVRNNRSYGGCTSDVSLTEGGGGGSDGDDSQKRPQDAFGGNDLDSSSNSEFSLSRICRYEHTGCYCCPYDDKGQPLDEPIKVTAEKRPGYVECLRPGCGAYMILKKNGDPKKVYKGRIFELAQADKSNAHEADNNHEVVAESPELPEIEEPTLEHTVTRRNRALFALVA